MKLTMFCLLLALSASPVPARIDLTGRWTGVAKISTSEGRAAELPVVALFTQKGKKLSGTLGPNETQQLPIANPRWQGKRVQFDMTSQSRLFRVQLTLTRPQELEGTLAAEDGKTSGTMRLSRRADSR